MAFVGTLGFALCALVSLGVGLLKDNVDVSVGIAISCVSALWAFCTLKLWALQKRTTIDPDAGCLTWHWRCGMRITPVGHQPLENCRWVAIRAAGYFKRFRVYLDKHALAQCWNYLTARALAERVADALNLEIWVFPRWPTLSTGVSIDDPSKFQLRRPPVVWEARPSVDESPEWLTVEKGQVRAEIAGKGGAILYLVRWLAWLVAVYGAFWLLLGRPAHGPIVGFCALIWSPLAYGVIRRLSLTCASERVVVTSRLLAVDYRSWFRCRVRGMWTKDLQQLEICQPLLKDGYLEFVRAEVLNAQSAAHMIEFGYNLSRAELELLRSAIVSFLASLPEGAIGHREREANG